MWITKFPGTGTRQDPCSYRLAMDNTVGEISASTGVIEHDLLM